MAENASTDLDKFVAYLLAKRVKQDTIDALVNDGIDNVEVLALLDNGVIRKMKLNTGQTLALTKAVAELAKGSDETARRPPEAASNVDIPLPHDPASNTSTPIVNAHLREQNIEQLLHEVQAADAILGSSNPAAERDPWIEGHATGKSSKALLVQDFCGLVIAPRVENELADFGDTKLVSKSGQRRPQPKDTSLSQYLVGSTRILAHLIQTNKLACNMQTIMGYLKYQIKIGEYLQTFSKDKVMLFDQEYRLQQAAGQIEWGEDSFHLGLKYLTTSQGYPTAAHKRLPNAPRFSQQIDPKSGLEICKNFQTPTGCLRQSCKFAHVCMKQGCYKAHPESQHHML